MKNHYYRTKDLSEAAYLYASNQKLVTLSKDDRKYWFVFDDKSSCQELVDSFWRKEAVVNARAFADSLRTLKDLIFNQERS